ncbi:hypothetical protein VZO05_00340 [Aggregatilineales bacterium SYSU G02658]
MNLLKFSRPLSLILAAFILLLSVAYFSAAQSSDPSAALGAGELMLESVSLETRSHVYTFAAHPECVTILFIRNDTMEIGPNIIVEDISGARPRLVDTLELPAFGQDLYLPPGTEQYRLTTNFTMSQEFPLQFYWLQLRLECDSVVNAAPAQSQQVALAPNGRSVFALTSTGQPIQIAPARRSGASSPSSGSRITLIVRDPLTNRILNALQLDLSAALNLTLPEGQFLLEIANNLLDELSLDLTVDANLSDDTPLVALNAEGIGFIAVAVDGSVDLGGSGINATVTAGSGGINAGVNVNPPSAPVQVPPVQVPPVQVPPVQVPPVQVPPVEVPPVQVPPVEVPPVQVPPVEVPPVQVPPVEVPPVQVPPVEVPPIVPTLVPPLLGG